MKLIGKKLGIIGISALLSINTFGAVNSQIVDRADVSVTYNGEFLRLNSLVKTVNGRTLVPLRDLGEIFGYQVNWDSKSERIDIIEGKTTVTLYLGKTDAKVGSKAVTLEVPAKTYNGITYVPLRFVSEAFGIGANWNKSSHLVELTGKEKKLKYVFRQHIDVCNDDKYSVDLKTKKLLMQTKTGKTAVADFTVFDGVESINVISEGTKGGSEIVTITETFQGALTNSGYITFYIKAGKVIQKIEREPSWLSDNGILTTDNNVVIYDKNILSIYDDKTGKVVETKDLSKLVPGMSLNTYDKDFLLGWVNNRLVLIDFKADKAQRIYDLIPSEADKEYVYEEDLFLTMDKIDYLGRSGDTLTFEYPSVTENNSKKITYTLGQ